MTQYRGLVPSRRQKGKRLRCGAAAVLCAVAAVALPLMIAGPLAAQEEQSVSSVSNPPSGRGSLCACSAGTTVVLLNQPPNQVQAYPADFAHGPLGQSHADGFVLADATISEIRIWGVYSDGNPPLVPDLFTVKFHNDGGGMPGNAAAPAESGMVPACRETTGVIFNGRNEYVYRLELTSPVTFDFGLYWLQIFNDTNSDLSSWFLWETGVEDTTAGFPNHFFDTEAPGVTWSFSMDSLAVQLCALSDLIFLDGFETGNTTAWSTAVGGSP